MSRTRCWVGAAVVLLDVWLEVVGVVDRSETWCQRGEGSDRHIFVVVSDLGSTIVLCGGHDLGSGLAIQVRDRTLRVAIVYLVLSTSPVLDVVAITIFMLHDAMDGTRGAVLTIIVEATSKLSLFALAVALVDVVASVAVVDAP
jgi:hypothetical protein